VLKFSVEALTDCAAEAASSEVYTACKRETRLVKSYCVVPSVSCGFEVALDMGASAACWGLVH
jgi:hypothetical protein